jgi:DNA protecting protein DprA
MTDVATKIILSDDPWMSRAIHPKSGYVPPNKSESIMLSEALHGTGRMPDTAQINFFGDNNDQSNLRIYYAGDLALLKRPSVAIVGTREVSEAGIILTKRLSRELVENGINIVSGLAYGVDTVAHTTAIETGGKTIAVIGTPLEKASPSENAKLQECIYREHLLISRFKTGEKIFRTNFPLRNRLMAVLSDATVVTEASDTSGTLHQAAECAKRGRWLFIVRTVIDNPSVTWPARFLKDTRTVILDRTEQIVDAIAQR